MRNTGLNDNTKDEEMDDVKMDKHKTWKIKGRSMALIAALAIGVVTVLSATVYGGYWWGSDVEVASEQTAGKAVPVPADIESSAINMEE